MEHQPHAWPTRTRLCAVQPGQGPEGGFPKVDRATYQPGDVLVYVTAPDIDATLARAAELGGTIVQGRTPIPGIGWMGLLRDPAGTLVGLFTGRAV